MNRKVHLWLSACFPLIDMINEKGHLSNVF